jgi:hypothetical protein
MLRIDSPNKALIALEQRTMRDLNFLEGRIQEIICRTPTPFWEELGEAILIVGSEVKPSDFVLDRIDLLGVDRDGAAVVVEIKRDNHKLHLLQALSYAGMVAQWEPKRFIEQLRNFDADHQALDQAKEKLEEFLEEGDIDAVNRDQRMSILTTRCW